MFLSGLKKAVTVLGSGFSGAGDAIDKVDREMNGGNSRSSKTPPLGNMLMFDPFVLGLSSSAFLVLYIAAGLSGFVKGAAAEAGKQYGKADFSFFRKGPQRYSEDKGIELEELGPSPACK